MTKLSIHATDDEVRQHANELNVRGLPKYTVEFYDQLLPDGDNCAEVDFTTSRYLSGATVRRFKLFDLNSRIGEKQ